jgi:hypothetical protein
MILKYIVWLATSMKNTYKFTTLEAASASRHLELKVQKTGFHRITR